MKRILMVIMLLSALLAFAGCGGGSGGGGAGGTSVPTTAAVTLLTDGLLPAGILIGDIEVALQLPAGVTVDATDSGNGVLVPNDGVVVLQGGAAGSPVNQQFTATYTPASGGTPGRVNLRLQNGNGLIPEAFALVNCRIAAGSLPLTTDFGVVSLLANNATGVADLSTANLPDITVKYSVVFK